MLRWFPMGSIAKYEVDPFLSSFKAFLMIVFKKRNFMQANSIFGVCFIVTAVRYTAVRSNQKFLLKSMIVVPYDSMLSLHHANVDGLR